MGAVECQGHPAQSAPFKIWSGQASKCPAGRSLALRSLIPTCHSQVGRPGADFRTEGRDGETDPWKGGLEGMGGSKAGGCFWFMPPHPWLNPLGPGHSTKQSQALRPRADDRLPFLSQQAAEGQIVEAQEGDRRESVWRKGGGSGGSCWRTTPPSSRRVHPSARLACCRFGAQHLPGGACGGPARALEVERSPPFPPPGRVKEHLRQPQYQQA